MGKLDGKIALVTGSSRGIGRGIAIEFAREGADLVINYRRNEAAAAETAGAVIDLGRRAVAVQADVSDWGQVQALVESSLNHYGRLDIVVANSGIASRVATVWDMDVDHWHRIIGTNLNGVFYTCKATAKHLVDQRSGSIILISSVGADTCGPLGSPYYSAKAAVSALTKCLAKECAPSGVRVNGIAPGLVLSDMGEKMVKFYGEAITAHIPLGRGGQPEEIGRAAVFLASDDARFITGQILRVDGGTWM